MSMNEGRIFPLPPDRQDQINDSLIGDYDRWRIEAVKQWNPEGKGEQKMNPREPSWATFATTNPVRVDGARSKGVRGCLAFHKRPCSYKMETEGLGCSHCALSKLGMNVSFVRPEDQIHAVKKGMDDIVAALGYTPPVFEILPDGSFMDDTEVSPETQNGVLHLMAENKSVFQVAVESRSEFLSALKIRHFLSMLRPDQSLELFVGLESVDPFVLNKIIKKGFTLEEFERKIGEVAANLTPEEKKRLHISVYHLFKPPYITEREAIDAAVAMADKVREFEEKTGIQFSVKYEPVVISDGTFQKYLFNQKKYVPPSYFSVAEIVALSWEGGFSDRIKFGQRDDIDDFQTVAAIPDLQNPNMFSPFDFMVYNAVQRFNADQDMPGFYADMATAIEHAPEFKKWEVDVYGSEGSSSLSRLRETLRGEGYEQTYGKRIEFQKKVWRVLDKIEYNAKLSKEISKLGKKCEQFIHVILQSLFSKEGITILQIKNIKFFDIGRITNAKKIEHSHPDFADATEGAVYQVEVIVENEMGIPQNVWAKVPLYPVDINLEKFDFIYGKT